MASAKPAKAPKLGEIARDDHGISMARAYTATMMDNPDSVLQTRGRDFTIYEEMLRDDQCKATLQQRRAAGAAKRAAKRPRTRRFGR